MDKRIVLTEEELSQIERYMKGDVDLVICNEDEQRIFSSVLDKVDHYEESLDAEEERMAEEASDGVVWLYKRYMRQEGKEPVEKLEKKFL